MLLVACSVVLCAASCSQRVDDPVPAESTAHKSQPIGNGTFDATNQFPAVAAIFSAVNCDGKGNCDPPTLQAKASCSAVLLTPVLVASAGHCFHAEKPGDLTPDRTFWVVFSNDLTNYDFDLAFLHSKYFSGEVKLMPDDYGSAKEGPKHDIALFTLDERVLPDIAKPLHPAGFLGLPACANSFTGTNIGYGSRSLCSEVPDLPKWLGGGKLPCNNTVNDTYAGWHRTFATSQGWYFEAKGQGGDYRRDFIDEELPFVPPIKLETTYKGSLRGDSGGPVLQPGATPETPRVCGVASRSDFTVVPISNVFPPFVYYAFDEYTRYAELDRGANLAFIEKRAKVTIPVDQQPKDTWLGECPPGVKYPKLRDQDSDGDYLPDACDPCPYVYDKTFHDTGVLGDYVNHDDDGDGVPDICDNCPGSGSNPYVSNGISLYQPDADEDGLGDACDKCNHSDLRGTSDWVCCNPNVPHQGDEKCGNPKHNYYWSRCVPTDPNGPVAGGLAQHPCPSGYVCSRGIDSDGDRFQDSCDNCRTEFNPDPDALHPQADADDDGVGDACDNCKGIHPQDPKLGLLDNDTTYAPADQNLLTCGLYPNFKKDCPCTDDNYCVAQTGNKQSECEPGEYYVDSSGTPGFKPRHCSKRKDSDHDGLGDVCDNCANTPNPDQHNCNKLAEQALKVAYPYLGDACDPDPCPWASKFTVNKNFDIDHPDTADLWYQLHEHPARLPFSVPQCGGSATDYCFDFEVSTDPALSQAQYDTAYTGTPHATLGHRICPCIADPNDLTAPLSVKACQFGAAGCVLDADEYNKSSSPWKKADVIETPAGKLPAHETSFPDEITNRPMELARDLLTIEPDQLQPSGYAPTELSWDLTANGAQLLSSPGAIEQDYGLGVIYWAAVRDVDTAVSPASNFQDWSNSYYAGPFGLTTSATLSGGQVKLLCPAGNCNDDCQLCRYWVDAHDLVTLPSQQRIFAEGQQGIIDVTSQFSEGAITLLSDPDLSWVTAAEGDRWISPSAVSLASVSSDGTTVLGALARADDGQIQPVVQSSTLPGNLGRATALPETAPPARSGFGVVLSATEHSLFVIGGTLASGEPAGDLWNNALWTNSWQELHITGPAPENVLAATFVPRTRSLYWLDERVPGSHQARLVRCDLDTLRTTLLGAWPRTPQVDRVYLTADTDGRLVLAGGSATFQYVAGVVLRPAPHSVAITAGFFHDGVPVFAPVLTEEALTVALAGGTPDNVQHVVIPVEDLFSQLKPKKGNGKAWGKQTQFTDVGQVL